MKIIIIPDSFKGSLTSIEAASAIKEGIILADPTCETEIIPIADGGEGTLFALSQIMTGNNETIQVTGPFQEKVNAQLLIDTSTKTAVIEMAQAAGLHYAKILEPLYATTYGVGEMIKYALQKGCRKFIIGLGGSATCDGGMGMLQALGVEFFDKYDKPVQFGLQACGEIFKLSTKQLDPRLSECHFTLASDVNNPLCGVHGSIAIFGPQKGVQPDQIELFDQMMANYADIMVQHFHIDHRNTPGAGAAGGLGFAFLTTTNSIMKSGIELLLTFSDFESKCQNADLIITGEGRIDHQSNMGKVLSGIVKITKKHNVAVVALAGKIDPVTLDASELGVDELISINDGSFTSTEAMKFDIAYSNCKKTAENIIRSQYFPFIKNGTMIPNASLNQVEISTENGYIACSEILSSQFLRQTLQDCLHELNIPLQNDIYDQCASLINRYKELQDRINQRICWTKSLILGLHFHDERIRRHSWNQRQWEAWQNIDHLVLCGGLMESSLGPIILAQLQKSIPQIHLEISAHSKNMSIIGAAKRMSLQCKQALLFDFGHTLVKRGKMVHQNDSSTIYFDQAIPASFTQWILQPTLEDAKSLHTMIFDILVQTIHENEHLCETEINIGMSIANYVDQGILIDRGGYGKLLKITDNYEKYLTAELFKKFNKPIFLKLIHDTTAASFDLPNNPHSALISFGTTLGVGFCQPDLISEIEKQTFTITNN